MWCLPELDFEPSPSEAPLLLAQVCHQWRSIALTTPRLWSCFRLSRPLYSTGYSNTVFLLLETWLSRSGSSPLTILQETGREFEREEDCPSLGPVLDLLL
ncbi:hypothetical protein C8J57DRAFT_1175391 [Mycena rebaudengoi]|nr:hypothetical protein C8J57DRAFT_1175391 [Mycena rebaudengoi]